MASQVSPLNCAEMGNEDLARRSRSTVALAPSGLTTSRNPDSDDADGGDRRCTGETTEPH